MQWQNDPIGELVAEEPAVAPSLSLFTKSEDVTRRVLSIIREAYGALPEQFWALSRSADLLAPRGFVVSGESSCNVYERHLNVGCRYRIVSLKIEWWRSRDPLIIMPGVKTLMIWADHKFNSDVKLCEGIEVVNLGGHFNKAVDFPEGLKRVEFGRYFKSPVILPSTLTELFFDYYNEFNQPITLPDSLLKATFGFEFDKPVLLPPNIEELTLGYGFNQDIDCLAAPKLRIVTFGDSFTKSVNLPDSLEEVYFGGKLLNQPVQLPQNLRKVTFEVPFNWPLTVPPRLEELIFAQYGDFNHAIDLPEKSCLKVLKLSKKFNKPIDLVAEIEEVFFGRDFNVPVILPSSLKTLTFNNSSEFNHAIDLPAGIKSCAFGCRMTHSVRFPVGLEKLTWFTNIPLDLPQGLKVVKLPSGYTQPLVLPQGCRRVN